jgi:hypothetical protein
LRPHAVNPAASWYWIAKNASCKVAGVGRFALAKHFNLGHGIGKFAIFPWPARFDAKFPPLAFLGCPGAGALAFKVELINAKPHLKGLPRNAEFFGYVSPASRCFAIQGRF